MEHSIAHTLDNKVSEVRMSIVNCGQMCKCVKVGTLHSTVVCDYGYSIKMFSKHYLCHNLLKGDSKELGSTQ